ncbi:MAG: HEAT repeat domain-containing protein [Phycisphaerales bacterium]
MRGVIVLLSALVACTGSVGFALGAPEKQDARQEGQKRLPTLPDRAPEDYPRGDSLGAIRLWLRAKWLESAKVRTPAGGDVISVFNDPRILPEAEWLRLVDRVAADLKSDNAQTLLDALVMARELEQTSFMVPSLRAPLGNKVFPAAAARLPNMVPEVVKQLPPLLTRLGRYSDPNVSIPVFVEEVHANVESVRRQGLEGFTGLVLESEEPIQLTQAQRIAMADAALACIDDPNEQIRVRAISLIGRARAPADVYVPKLIELLKHENTRFPALRALGEYGPSASAAVPAMVEMLKAIDIRTLQQTCDALRGLGAAASDAVPALIPLLDSQSRSLAASAAGTLGAIGPGAAAALPKLDELSEQKTPTSGEFKRAAESIRGVPAPN